VTVRGQRNWFTLEHNAAALNGFDEVFGCLCHKTEAGLMRMEFQNASQGLLGDHGKVIGIIQKNPGRGSGHGSHTPHKFRETLTNGGNTAIICGGETECHRGLVCRIHDTLCSQLFADPRIRQHRLADSRGSPENQMGWIRKTGAEEFDCRFLAKYGVHCSG
jgi:hypothetical protein